MADIGVIGALAAWRVTQGIYCFDPTIHEVLASTPLETLPVEALYRLPEWCVYLETPEHEHIHGGFVHLEWDVNRKQAELRFVLDMREEELLAPLALHLDRSTLDEALVVTSKESEH